MPSRGRLTQAGRVNRFASNYIADYVYCTRAIDLNHSPSPLKLGRGYSFRVGGQRKFFLEAKKASVNVKDDAEPAFQLCRYELYFYAVCLGCRKGSNTARSEFEAGNQSGNPLKNTVKVK